MKALHRKLKFFMGFYLAILIALLACVGVTPIFVQHGISITNDIIIEEEMVEFVLITVLFGISYLIFRSFKKTLNAYRSAVEEAREEKTSLVSRLSEAFHYIGCVNSEIQSIQSVLTDTSRYPGSKREFKEILDHLSAKAASIAAAPWAVIRIICKSSGRTVTEHAFEMVKGTLPAVTAGNRAILENHQVEGIMIISANHNNLDLRTTCIIPSCLLSKQESLLLTAIANQAELYFMLYRSGVPHKSDSFASPPQKKEGCHAIPV